jgi:hypothetical protein
VNRDLRHSLVMREAIDGIMEDHLITGWFIEKI